MNKKQIEKAFMECYLQKLQDEHLITHADAVEISRLLIPYFEKIK